MTGSWGGTDSKYGSIFSWKSSGLERSARSRQECFTLRETCHLWPEGKSGEVIGRTGSVTRLSALCRSCSNPYCVLTTTPQAQSSRVTGQPKSELAQGHRRGKVGGAGSKCRWPGSRAMTFPWFHTCCRTPTLPSLTREGRPGGEGAAELSDNRRQGQTEGAGGKWLKGVQQTWGWTLRGSRRAAGQPGHAWHSRVSCDWAFRQ